MAIHLKQIKEQILKKSVKNVFIFFFSISITACQSPSSNQSSAPVLLFSDNFTSSQQWYVSTTTARTFSYVSDGYDISTGQSSSWWWSNCPYTNQNSFSSPFIVELTAKATLADQTNNGGFGIAFDQTDNNNFSWVSFDKSGNFKINKWIAGSAANPPIIDWTPASSFVSGSSNTIKIKHDQNGIELFVNGTSVAKSSSFSIPSSAMKISIIDDNFGTTSTTAHFTDFKLYRE